MWFHETENMSTQGDTCKLSDLAFILTLEADSSAEDQSSPLPQDAHTQKPDLWVTLTVFDVA